MNRLAILVSLLLVSANASASLSSYCDSVSRITTALQSSDLAAKVSGEVSGFRQVEPLVYEIYTTKCVATVELLAHYSDQPGPTDYTVESVKKVYCEK